MSSKKATRAGKGEEKKKRQHEDTSAADKLKDADHASEDPAFLSPELGASPPLDLQLSPSTDNLDSGMWEAGNQESDMLPDEPTLTELIIETYNGERQRGHFEGFGVARFTSGNVYEGMFSDGMMHGKGRYTWVDEGTTYEGDFSHNQIIGKGIYTWPDGSMYDGDVVNGTRHGEGSYRHPSGLAYTGDWMGGRRHGEGRMDYDVEGRSFYDGEWYQSIRHGWGIRQYPSGNTYEGQWCHGLRHGMGTMRWMDRDELYSGQWETGIQNGMGQHVWFVRRIKGSQYPLRNEYVGEFVGGRREGQGTFIYPNGAKYVGGWRGNLKSGMGKFIFKNGRVYEGEFENDRIIEFPNFTANGGDTPDLTKIRTRSPRPDERPGSAAGRSTEAGTRLVVTFTLQLDRILADLPSGSCEDAVQEEISQVECVLLQHYGPLRHIYYHYSALGEGDASTDNTFVMRQMQFWRLLKDCQLHCMLPLAEMDRRIALANHVTSPEVVHNPQHQILLADFINNIVVLSYALFSERHKKTDDLILSRCLETLIVDHLLPHACQVGGHLYSEARRAQHALPHLDKAYLIYRAFCRQQPAPLHDETMLMRQFLYMIKDFRLINVDLTARAIITILSDDDPTVSDGDFINLDGEMIFLEFFEALIGCATAFVTAAVIQDPSTPRAGCTTSQEQQLGAASLPNVPLPSTPARSESQGGLGGTSKGDGKSQAIHSEKPSRQKGSRSSGKQQQQASPTVTSKTRAAGQIQDESLGLVSDLPMESTSSMVGIQPDPGPRYSLVTEPSKPGLALEGGQTTSAMSDVGDESGAVAVDEVTRAFNFWTYQLHIFFVRKLFPAADRYAKLEEAAAQRLQLVGAVANESEIPCSSGEEVQQCPGGSTELLVPVEP